jgi:hypothetical protein
MHTNEFPELVQFLGGYFHQDFLLDYGNPNAAIEAYLAESPLESILSACKELERIIPLLEQMDKPETFLWQTLGCYYDPKADGLTVVDWLNQVRKKLAASGMTFAAGS